jgi:hypothetical protein
VNPHILQYPVVETLGGREIRVPSSQAEMTRNMGRAGGWLELEGEARQRRSSTGKVAHSHSAPGPLEAGAGSRETADSSRFEIQVQK